MGEQNDSCMGCREAYGVECPFHGRGVPVGSLQERYSEALRELASYVGNGGYNAPDPVDAATFIAKIRDVIDEQSERIVAQVNRIAALEAELAEARADVACMLEGT